MEVNIQISGSSLPERERLKYRAMRGLYINPIPYTFPDDDDETYTAWREAGNQVEALFREDLEAFFRTTGKPWADATWSWNNPWKFLTPEIIPGSDELWSPWENNSAAQSIIINTINNYHRFLDTFGELFGAPIHFVANPWE